MELAGGGEGGVGDGVGKGALQDPGDVLLTGDEVDHGDLAPVVPQQVQGEVGRVSVPRGLLDGLADISAVLGPAEGGDEDVLPAHQVHIVVEIPAVIQPVQELPPCGAVFEPLGDGGGSALQKLRRQDVDELGAPGGVGVHVAAHIQPRLSRVGDAL